MSQILVIGSINLDISIELPHLPQEGETILANNSSVFSGGKGLNQAVAISRLGGDVQMVGAIGDDKNGQIILDKLEEEEMNTSEIMTFEQTETGVAYIAIDQEGQNFIIVNPGANFQIEPSDILKKIDAITNAKCVILQFELPILVVSEVIKVCKVNNIPVILNPAPAVNVVDLEMFSGVDYLIPNETELALLTKDLPQEATVEERSKYLLELGCKHVITTLGSEGAMLVNSEGSQHYPSVKVKAVDTTAAGDSFVGAFAKMITNGKDLDAAIKFANNYAALTVEKLGAQSSIPTIDEYHRKYTKAPTGK